MIPKSQKHVKERLSKLAQKRKNILCQEYQKSKEMNLNFSSILDTKKT